VNSFAVCRDGIPLERDMRAVICFRQVLQADVGQLGQTWLRAMGSRRAAAITAILGFFTGYFLTDGYAAYQQLLPKLAGI
jgi:hypothetical protein